MAKLDGAQIIVRVLKQQGVEYVFGLIGGHTFRIFQECKKSGIQVIDTRHETAAVHAAMAYSHATGKVGVVCLTAGPGVVSGIDGIADAHLSYFPLVVIGGSQRIERRQTKDMQEIDILSILKPITNWAESCPTIGRLADYTTMAFREALLPPRGPSFLEVPVNLLVNDSIDEDLVDVTSNQAFQGKVYADPKLIDQAADLLLSTESTAMVMGDLIMFNLDNSQVFGELAEYLQMPIAQLGEGARFLSGDHVLTRVGQVAGSMAEVLISFNSVNDYIHGGFNAPRYSGTAKTIQIHEDPKLIGFNRSADIGIVGTPDIVAKQLLDAIKAKAPKRETSAFVNMLEGMFPSIKQMIIEEMLHADKEPCHPGSVVMGVIEFLKNEGTEYDCLADGGDSCTYMGNGLAMHNELNIRKSRLLISGVYKFGSIGWSLGATTGHYLATKQPILLTIGDGAIGQYLAELFTYAKHNIPVICLISNNSCWNMIKSFSDDKYPDEESDTGNILESYSGEVFRYEKLAQAWDGYHEFVTDPAEIHPALVRAKDSGKISIINVQTMRGVCPQATLNMYGVLFGPREG